ncbi:MAG: sugar phosphate isomerase/epimerase [Clostridia bacterium]|nr:sugar phosphate isomerase/epimerase [Clostridia bacterium]
MKLGVSTACFYGKEHVEDTFEILKNMGVDTTEVFLNTFSEYEKPFVEELVKRKELMKVHSVHAHGTCFEPELFSSYSRIRDDAEAIFKKVCISAFMLGAKNVTFHGPFAKRGRAVNVNMSDFTKRLNELCDVAENCGVSIAYENVNWAYCDTPDFFKAIKEQCPRLKGTLDIKQAIYSGVDPYKFLDVMEDRLVTVHICDMDNKNKPTLPPEGKFNFEKLFRELNARTPLVTVLLEVYNYCYRDYEHLAESYHTLRDMLNKVVSG